ncbi:MAG: lactonase family protein [Lachnospiraceae bacterium]|nr:lactonase family protein [Lachnospiraceae bacterium]
MEHQILLGCYTNQNKNTEAPKAEGIYLLTIGEDGSLKGVPKLLAKQDSPSYFCKNREGTRLYAVSEPGEGEKGYICAYRILREEGTVSLELINKMMAAGRGLCYCALDGPETNLVVVSYPDSTIQSYPLREDGSLRPMFCLRKHVGSGPVLDRQESAHAHCSVFTPDGQHMAVCDLGTDTIYMYSFLSDSGKIHRAYCMNVQCPAGSGPRHIAFSKDGRNAYVTCELNNQVLVMSFDGENGLKLQERVNALNPDFDIAVNYPSAVRVAHDDESVYISNRGEDTIAHYRRDRENGRLTMLKSYSTRGWYPRDFILTEDQKLLVAVNQLSDNLVVFRIGEGGEPELLEEKVIVQKPIALLEI